MLSTRILAKCNSLVQIKCAPHIGKARQDLFEFGLQALSFKPLVSLNANARMVITDSRNTAQVTMTRLLHNARLTQEMSKVVGALGIVTPTSVVCFDHTEHDGAMGLVGAVQTGRGRAVPCFNDTSISGKLPAHEDAPPRKKTMRAEYNANRQKLTDHTVQALKQFRIQCGFWPKLVFDRWYAYRELVELLVHEQATFYVRMKAGRFVELYGDRVLVRDLANRDQEVTIYGQKLRLVISPKSKAWKEPWYVLTSDFGSSTKRIIKFYYHRFEIEESFKDVKHLRGLIKIQVQKALSFKVILWFMILGIILLYLAAKLILGARRLMNSPDHPKKQLSWFRRLLELLDQLMWTSVHDLFRWKRAQPMGW
jgi:hypothetical protein